MTRKKKCKSVTLLPAWGLLLPLCLAQGGQTAADQPGGVALAVRKIERQLQRGLRREAYDNLLPHLPLSQTPLTASNWQFAKLMAELLFEADAEGPERHAQALDWAEECRRYLLSKVEVAGGDAGLISEFRDVALLLARIHYVREEAEPAARYLREALAQSDPGDRPDCVRELEAAVLLAEVKPAAEVEDQLVRQWEAVKREFPAQLSLKRFQYALGIYVEHLAATSRSAEALAEVRAVEIRWVNNQSIPADTWVKLADLYRTLKRPDDELAALTRALKRPHLGLTELDRMEHDLVSADLHLRIAVALRDIKEVDDSRIQELLEIMSSEQDNAARREKNDMRRAYLKAAWLQFDQLRSAVDAVARETSGDDADRAAALRLAILRGQQKAGRRLLNMQRDVDEIPTADELISVTHQLHNALEETLTARDSEIFQAKDVFQAKVALASLYLDNDDVDRARPLLETSHEYWRSRIERHPRWAGQTLKLLAEVNPTEAQAWLEQALCVCCKYPAETQRLKLEVQLKFAQRRDVVANQYLNLYRAEPNKNNRAAARRELLLLLLDMEERASCQGCEHPSAHKPALHGCETANAESILPNTPHAILSNATDDAKLQTRLIEYQALAWNNLANLRFDDWLDAFDRWKRRKQELLNAVRSDEYEERVSNYNRRVSAFESLSDSLRNIERTSLINFQKEIKREYATMLASQQELEGQLRRELELLLEEAECMAKEAVRLLANTDSKLECDMEKALKRISERRDATRGYSSGKQKVASPRHVGSLPIAD